MTGALGIGLALMAGFILGRVTHRPPTTTKTTLDVAEVRGRRRNR